MAEPREVATRIVRTLRHAGRTAYFAGGCVRDELLGLLPKDYDVATDATPTQVRALFRSVNEVGAAFGVMLVRVDGVVVEVATFREEGVYTDRRRPDEVRFADARADASRRDFTVNALFLDPLATDDAAAPGATGPRGGTVIDFVGGREDLARRLIRAVGDPNARLAEDHLRALRAVRLAARLGFTIEPGTRGAIAAHAGDLRGVSRERIGDELRKMLSHPARALAASEIESLGLDACALDEPHLCAPGRALPALVDGADVVTAMAAWAADRIGAADGAGQGSIGDALGARAAEVTRRWRRALCLSNDESAGLANILAGAAELLDRWAEAGVAQRKRLASAPWFSGAAAVAGAWALPGWSDHLRADVDVLARTPGGLSPDPFITGDDLVAAGMLPGPGFRRILDDVYDAQLEGRVRDAAAALDLARRLASRA